MSATTNATSPGNDSPASTHRPESKQKQKPNQAPRSSTNIAKLPPNQGSKLRGHPRDNPETRISKTLSWLLRHGAAKEGVEMRSDGFINVGVLLTYRKFVDEGLTFNGLKKIVDGDGKKRYMLVRELPSSPSLDPIPAEAALIAQTGAGAGDRVDVKEWWIRANQGHSIKDVDVEMTPILSASDVPMVVHGTTRAAWEIISKEGLSKMTRNHIHFAQAVGESVISGMRKSSQVLIYVNLSEALSAGIKFVLSANGVVLTEGDERGFLGREFFERVEDAKGNEIVGWR